MLSDKNKEKYLIFQRLFSSEDGEKVLSYLKVMSGINKNIYTKGMKFEEVTFVAGKLDFMNDIIQILETDLAEQGKQNGNKRSSKHR